MAIERLDPAECIVWEFHARHGTENSTGFCSDLVESFRLHGQRHPVLGRRPEGLEHTPVEIIYGARRLYAARELGIKLLVDIRRLDDRAAVIEMEIENRNRTDISPYERGMAYRRWLNASLFSSQAELASHIGVSESQVSRLLKYADLPAVVVAAFDSVRSIREEWAVALARACKTPHRRQLIVRRAREASLSRSSPPPHVTYRRLISDDNPLPGSSGKRRDEVVRNASGKPLYRIGIRASTVHFIFSSDRLSEDAIGELRKALAVALERLTTDAVRIKYSPATALLQPERKEARSEVGVATAAA